MPVSSRKIQWLVWGTLFCVIAGIVIAYVGSEKKRSASGADSLGFLRKVTEFSLTNQFDQRVSLADLRGQVWLADIIFSRCGGPCPRMTRQVAVIQSNLPPTGVKIVTLTADPAYDTPVVLNKYAERFGADAKRWNFLTGPKAEIYKLAMDGLLLAVEEKSEQEKTSIDDLFIHSTLFVLVDRKGNVRSFYESTEPDTNQKVLADIQRLLAE